MATATLTTAATSGNVNINQSQLGQAPFNGTTIPSNVGTVTISAGGNAVFSPTPAQLAQFPIINVVTAAATVAGSTITLPLASLTTGLRFRIVMSGNCVQGITVNVTGAVAGNFIGTLFTTALVKSVAASVSHTYVGGTSLSGDFVEYVSNGSFYTVLGLASVVNSFTVLP